VAYLAAEELAKGGAEDLASVRSAGVGGLASSLELDLPSLTLGVDHLAQIHRRTVLDVMRGVRVLDMPWRRGVPNPKLA
jgi:hypothetical protein